MLLVRSTCLLLIVSFSATISQNNVVIGFAADTSTPDSCAQSWAHVGAAVQAVSDLQLRRVLPPQLHLRLENVRFNSNSAVDAWRAVSSFSSRLTTGASTALLQRVAMVTGVDSMSRDASSAMALQAQSVMLPLLSASFPPLESTDDVFPSVYRMSGPESWLGYAVYHIIRRQGWALMSVAHARQPRYEAIAKALQEAMLRDVTVGEAGDTEPLSIEQQFSFPSSGTRSASAASASHVFQQLEALQEGSARIVLLLAPPADASVVLQYASQLEMTGKGWTWLGVDWVQETTWATALPAPAPPTAAGGEGAPAKAAGHRLLRAFASFASSAAETEASSLASVRATVKRAMEGAVGVTFAWPTAAQRSSGLPRITQARHISAANISSIFYADVNSASPVPTLSSCPSLAQSPAFTAQGQGAALEGPLLATYESVWALGHAVAQAYSSTRTVVGLGARVAASLSSFVVANSSSVVRGGYPIAPLSGWPLRWSESGRDRAGAEVTVLNVQGGDIVRVATWASTASISKPWSGELNSTAAIVWPGGSSLSPPDRADRPEKTGAVAVLLALLGLAASLAVGSYLHKLHVEWLPESGATVLVGVCLGLIVRMSMAAEQTWPGALPGAASVASHTGFNNEIFMLVLLPIIIFESGYSLDQSPFFRNLWSITLFAVAGTLISAVTIGGIIYWAGTVQGWVLPLSWEECMSFASLLSATDPVATLAVFGALKVDPLLNSLVYGESVLNDAVGLAAYSTFTSFLVAEVSQTRVQGAIGRFIALLTISVVVGTVVSLVATLVFRLLHVPTEVKTLARETMSSPVLALPRSRGQTQADSEQQHAGVIATPSRGASSSSSTFAAATATVRQRVGKAVKHVMTTGMTITGRGHGRTKGEDEQGGEEEDDPFAGVGESMFLLVFCYVSFALAEALWLSGIVSALFCGIAMSTYTRPIMTREGKRMSSAVFKLLASLADTAVFLQIGLNVVLLYGRGRYDFPFIIITLLACLLGRALNIFPLSALLNWGRVHQIPMNVQIQMWHAGLRGAIAFASALTFPTQHRQTIVNATSWICMFTIFAMGTTTTTSLKALKIPYGSSAPAPSVLSTPQGLDRQSTPSRSPALALRAKVEQTQAFDRGKKLMLDLHQLTRRVVYGPALLQLVQAVESEQAYVAKLQQTPDRAGRSERQGSLPQNDATFSSPSRHDSGFIPRSLSIRPDQIDIASVARSRRKASVEMAQGQGTADFQAALQAAASSLAPPLAVPDSQDDSGVGTGGQGGPQPQAGEWFKPSHGANSSQHTTELIQRARE